MSRPIEQIEWELSVARAMYIDAMMWIGELRQELAQAKKEATNENPTMAATQSP